MLTPRIESAPGFLLAGLRRRFLFQDMDAGIPRLWEEFVQKMPLPGQIGTTTFGAGCQVSEAEGWFEYMASVEVADLAAVPEGFSRMRVPAAQYAVFTLHGHVSELRPFWDAIWKDWYPNSGHTFAPSPDFERYGPAFDPATGSGEIEVWFPIQ